MTVSRSRIILVVDDNPMALETIANEIIHNMKMRVLLAEDVREALLVLETFLVDLIVCDYEMPDGKGTTVLEHVSQKMPQVPFIFFSGNYDLELPLKAPLVKIINDKNYFRLFEAIKKYSLC
jgi:CheY-like chemotaxis protein